MTKHAKINVKDYGAAGDGVTDDSVAVRAAQHAASLSGGELYFPSGDYAGLADMGLRVDGNGVFIIRHWVGGKVKVD